MTSSNNPFTNVDASAEPSYAVRYLDAQAEHPAFRESAARSVDELRLQPGSAALDVGCGVGRALKLLSRAVGATGTATGVDMSATMLKEARSRLREAATSARLLAADAFQLPFADETFDGTRTERVLMHLATPPDALAEMMRVTKRGARIAAVEIDQRTSVIDLPEDGLRAKMRQWSLERGVRQPFAGSSLYRWFKEAGLAHVSATAIPVVVYGKAAQRFQREQQTRQARRAESDGAITAEEAEVWIERATQTIERGLWYSSFNLSLVAATRE